MRLALERNSDYGWERGATLTFRLHENLPNLSSQIVRVFYSKIHKGLKGDNLSYGSVQILLSPLCMILFHLGGRWVNMPPGYLLLLALR